MRLKLQLRTRQTGVEKLSGARLRREHIGILLTGDAEVYRPDGEPLVTLIRGAIDPELDEQALPALRDLAINHGSHNRGLYAGLPRGVRIRADGTKNRSTQTMTAEGKLANVHSAIAGYFDRQGGRFPFCRATVFTAQEVEHWGTILPLVKRVAEAYQVSAPQRYAAQALVAKEVLPDWRIAGTPFSTITVNHNVLGAIHCDKGDCKAGLGCISVVRRGSYRGAILGFPEYGVGVDMQDGDLLLFNSHDWHGVTDFVDKAEDAERISIVYYLREKLQQCGTPAQELARAQAASPGLQR